MVEIPDLEDLKKMKVPELNDLCKQLGIDTKVSSKIAFPPSFGWIRRLFEDSSYKFRFIAPVQSIRLHQVRAHMRSMHQSTFAPLAIAMTVTICQPDLVHFSKFIAVSLVNYDYSQPIRTCFAGAGNMTICDVHLVLVQALKVKQDKIDAIREHADKQEATEVRWNFVRVPVVFPT